jgi:hypothetical protein
MASKAGGGKPSRAGCPYCGAAVKEENLPRHLVSVHPGNSEAIGLAKKLEAEGRRSKSKGRAKKPAYRGSLMASRTVIALVIAGVVIAAGAAAYVFIPRPPDQEFTAPLTSICYGREDFTYHRHAWLHIIINNVPTTIPSNVGLPQSQGGLDTCFRPVHTHETQPDAALIHIESRIARVYTVGEFFELWALNQPFRTIRFDANHLMDRDTSNGGSITMRVDDRQSTLYEDQPLVYLDRPASYEPHIFITYTDP